MTNLLERFKKHQLNISIMSVTYRTNSVTFFQYIEKYVLLDTYT